MSPAGFYGEPLGRVGGIQPSYNTIFTNPQ